MAGADQYVTVNWRCHSHRLDTIAARGIPLNRRVSFASAARVPRRAPSHAGTRASRSVATASAAGARTPRSSQAGHNRRRKNFLVITLAASGTASLCWWFSAPDALPVAPALPVPLLFAGRRGPVSLLGLPPRPCPRRLPALLAAIALPRMSRPKALLTSFEQTPPGPWPARQPFAPAALLIFGMACSTLGRAQGRSLLPEALPRRGLHSSPGRSRSSGQYEINNSIAKIGFWLGPLPRFLIFSLHRGAGRSVCWPRAGVTMISPGETEAGTAGMQPLPRDNLAGSSRR